MTEANKTLKGNLLAVWASETEETAIWGRLCCIVKPL